MRKVLTIILLISFTQIFGQTSNFSKIQKLELQDANLYFDSAFYHLALPIYKKLFKFDNSNTEINYKIGICHFQQRDKSLSNIKYFKTSTNDYPKSHFYIAQIYHYNELFSKAIKEYNNYKSKTTVDIFNTLIKPNIEKSIFAQESYNNPKNINIRNLGSGINTRFEDYVPLITADDSVLFFTSRRKHKLKAKTNANKEFFEDIYVSYKIGKSWNEPKHLGKPINTKKGHDATVSISADGKKLFIYRTNKDLSGGDIYESNFEKGKWTKPEKMKGDINCKYCWNSSGSISPDGKTFYFSSNKSGGFGGKDLYKVQKLPNGEWGNSMNLGNKINTKLDDDAPFIHQDGRTLYFSSKGHQNMGGYDIFKSILDDNGNWSDVENLKYPINSAKDDIFFVVTADGKKAYYSSEKKGGYGKNDIYEVEMPDNLSNYLVYMGYVNSEISNEQIEAEITVTDLTTNKIHGVYKTNSVTKRYILVLLPNRKYKCVIQANGYNTNEYEINLNNEITINDLYKNITLEKK